jgi:sugar lactone lactonase YvrE
MYYADSGTFRVDAFDYRDETGQIDIESRRTILEFSEQVGPPDGMAVDVDGNLWIALVQGHRVSCFSPIGGEELARITVNAAKVTACCFGGPEMKHVFITTAKDGKDDPPASGAIFVTEPGVRGAVSPDPRDTA